jgi:hypothetical protein
METELRRHLAVFYTLLSSLKIPRQEALNMSKRLVYLCLDLSSFFDVPVDKVFQNIASALIGNTRAVYGYGISLDKKTLTDRAYSEGLAEHGSELTKQQKLLAAYMELLKQTENIENDFIECLDKSPQNQLTSSFLIKGIEGFAGCLEEIKRDMILCQYVNLGKEYGIDSQKLDEFAEKAYKITEK